MITQIEIDGFKTFKDFKVELAPFQVIVGPNGSGKSNLFDALHLLSRLADTDLRTAFQEVRGDPHELFTLLPNGKRTDRIRIAVEMLIDRKVQDSGGGKLELIGEAVALKRDTTVKYRRLRYELEVTLGTDTYGLDRFYINHESLKSIPSEKDRWSRNYKPFSQDGELPDLEERVFIATELTRIAVVNSRTDSTPQDVNAPMILQHPDEQGRLKRFYADEVQRTVLSRVSEIDYLHAFAARGELRALRFLCLNPQALRRPSAFTSPATLSPEGANLPATLARIQAEDQFAFHWISLDMANLVPAILKIEVEEDQVHNEYRILAKTTDRRTFSSQLLSDGTLRLLALATLRNDPQFRGTLCLEEPENGVNPLQLKKMAMVLREVTTNFNDAEQKEEPLRQILITTHSPAFIMQPDIRDSLLLAFTPTRVEGKGKPAMFVTRMAPVITPDSQNRLEPGENESIAVEAATLDQVRQYLESETLDETLDYLKQARANLSNRGRI